MIGLAPDGTTTTFSHPRNESPPSDLTPFYEWSPNLTDWYAGDDNDGPTGGPTVLISLVNSGTTSNVEATATHAMERLFLRVGVSQN